MSTPSFTLDPEVLALKLPLLGATLVLTLLLIGCGGGGDACSEEPGSVCIWAGTGEAGFNGDGHDRTSTRLYWPVDVSASLPTAPSTSSTRPASTNDSQAWNHQSMCLC